MFGWLNPETLQCKNINMYVLQNITYSQQPNDKLKAVLKLIFNYVDTR